MKVYRNLDELPSFRNAVVTTGSFDGVHIGHQKILRHICQLARTYEGESVVITFDPHPRQVIYPKDDSLRLITSTSEKLSLLEQFGIDNAVVLPFTIEFSQQHAREYVEKFLLRFNPACLVVGYDHRFGLNREGDYTLLQQYSSEGKFDLVKIGKQDIEDVTVSSTKIREAITQGLVKKANQLLGHTFKLCGVVEHGQKLGKSLGYPTANLKPETRFKLLPGNGIYAVHVITGELRFPGMMYIGKRPTVAEEDAEISIEVNIFDFEGDLYDESLCVEIVDFIRADKKLDNVEELRQAIQQDEKAVKAVLSVSPAETPDSNVAIVALNYNGARVLPKYLPSFNTHSCGAKVIIADNGSTDNSVDYIEKNYSAFEIIRLTHNTGYAGGYNAALKGVDYKYLALVNTDIELTDNWLPPLIEVLEGDPTIAAVQPKILDSKDKTKFEYAGGCGGYIDSLGYPFCSGRILSTVEKDDGQYDIARDIFWASGAAFVIRADVFKQMGGFDADYFAHMEEIDLCWRIQSAGYRIAFVPSSHVYHEGGATLPYESSRKVFLNFRNNMATIIKNRSFGELLYILPLRTALDVLAAVHFIASGKGKNAVAIARAYLALLAWIPALMRKRREIGETRSKNSVGPPLRRGWLSGSILWQYYAKGRKHFSQLKITHESK